MQTDVWMGDCQSMDVKHRRQKRCICGQKPPALAQRESEHLVTSAGVDMRLRVLLSPAASAAFRVAFLRTASLSSTRVSRTSWGIDLQVDSGGELSEGWAWGDR